MKQNKVLTGSLCALGCETLYGLSYIFTRKATANAGELALLGWRFLIAAIIVTILAAAGAVKINLKNKPLKYLVAVAVFNPCIYFIAETFGISNTTASESGVFLACIPVVSLAASTLVLKKKPSKIQIAGILITLIGVIITVLVVSASSSLSIIGYVSLSFDCCCFVCCVQCLCRESILLYGSRDYIFHARFRCRSLCFPCGC